jgi:hypothetical protein
MWRSAFPLLVLLVACEANKTHLPNGNPYEAGMQPPLSCVPDLDGIIQPSELQPVLNMPASYTVNPAGTTRPVDVEGTTDSSGHLVWDWGASYAGDQVANIEATSLSGKWYASSFPSAAQEPGKQLFVTPFDPGDVLEGVYAQDDTGLYLLGLASSQQSPPGGQTLYVYQSPITLYPLPLQVGAAWKSVGVVRNGSMLAGLPYAGQDEYDGTDDATGELLLPDFKLTQAHRIRFTVIATPAVGTGPIVTRQVSFLFECFGEVGRAKSQSVMEGDAGAAAINPNFTTAAEIRRLGM